MTELPYSTWSGAAPGSWLARWLSACADLDDLFAHHHLLNAIIEEIDGRRIRVGERWLTDFASCNYLGLDLDREVIEAIPAYLDQWGTHPSWSRMLGSPALYRQIETRLTELLGAADSLLLPTLTHIHASVIPVLASDGTIFVDSRAHKTIWDGCVAARAHGATVVRYAHDDPEALERLLHRHPKAPRLVCMDGVNSMTATRPTCRPSSPWPGRTTPCCTSTTPTALGWWASATGPRSAPSAAAATGSSATWASATTTSCSPAASPRPTRRCWPSSPARPNSSAYSRSRPPVPVLGPVPGGLAGQRARRARCQRGQGGRAAGG